MLYLIRNEMLCTAMLLMLGSKPVEELKMTVVMDQGQPVVAVVGPRQIKIGGRQAAGKRKARPS